ncbi:alpha/beta hydrolase [Vibrio alfacsensis]|uniref:alpha/beta hydrolase n=1 Tax=Vibrio alfacsensis TaxID=1074311 RepID=UPI0040685361
MKLTSSYVVLFLSLSMITACESLFFWPSKDLVDSPSEFNFKQQNLYFLSQDSTQLHAWLIKSEKPRGLIFFLHGNAQNLSYHIANIHWAIEVGYDVFIMDYRGFGRSKGEPSFELIQQDAMAGYKLAQEVNNSDQLIVWGQSLGGAVAVNLVADLTERDKPDGLIIDSSFSSHRKIMQETLGKSWLFWMFQYPLSWLISDDFAPENRILSIRGVPTLIVHSKEDPIIDEYHSKRLYDLSNEPKALWLTETNGHIAIWRNEQWQEKIKRQLVEWPVLMRN